MVMADLSGFTALSERLAKLGDEGAERLTAIINSFFERMLKTASRYGGDTLTFGGDAILLLFDGPEHAARAVAASLGDAQAGRARGGRRGGRRQGQDRHVGRRAQRHVRAGAASGSPDERAHLFVLGRGAEQTALAEAQAERGQLAVSAATKKLLPAAREAGAGRRLLAGRRARRRGAAAPVPGAGQPSTERRGARPVRRAAAAARPVPAALRAGRTAKTRAGASSSTPEHRRTVIVFVNILGLNELIERAGLDAALEQLQTYAAMLTRLAAKHHGFVVSSDIATQGSKLDRHLRGAGGARVRPDQRRPLRPRPERGTARVRARPPAQDRGERRPRLRRRGRSAVPPPVHGHGRRGESGGAADGAARAGRGARQPQPPGLRRAPTSAPAS